MKETKEENREIVKKHANIPGLKTVIDKLIIFKKQSLPNEFEKIQSEESEKQDYLLEITMRMFLTVVAELKKNIPFEAHS